MKIKAFTGKQLTSVEVEVWYQRHLTVESGLYIQKNVINEVNA